MATIKYAKILGIFNCLGKDKFGPLKLFGGVNKDHPNKNDLNNAKAFYKNLVKDN